MSDRERYNNSSNSSSSGVNVEGQKRVVLSEEEYVSTLSEIIERDYYPALNSLKRDVSILEKRKEGDIAGAVAIRRAARKLEQAKQMELQQELILETSTTSSTSTGSSKVRSIARPLHHESVDGFHQRVTSEDNQEFHQQYQNQSNQQLLLLTHQTNKNIHSHNKSFMMIQPASTNPLFFPPSHHNNNNNNNNNHLLLDSLKMPPPPNKTSTKQLSKQLLVEYIPKPKNEKDILIQPSQTRFSHQSQSRLSHPNNTTTHSSLTTTTTTNNGDETTDLDEIDDEDHTTLSQQRKKRLQKEQSTYVCMTPQITPNSDSNNNQSPIITWGTIETTPLVLPPSSYNFDLPPVPLKEQKARAIEAKLYQQRISASSTPKKKYKRQKRSSTTPKNRTPSNIINARSSSAFGSALRASYSTPIHTPKHSTNTNSTSTRRTKRTNNQQSTPKFVPSQKQKQQKITKPIISGTSTSSYTHSTENITDGLLHFK